MTKLLIGLIRNLVTAWVCADLWRLGFVPIGGPDVPMLGWLCLLELVSLFKLSVTTDSYISAEMEKPDDHWAAVSFVRWTLLALAWALPHFASWVLL